MKRGTAPVARKENPATEIAGFRSGLKMAV